MRLVSASLFCSSNSSSNIDLLPDFECVKFTSHWTWTMATSNYSVCVTLKFASKLPQCGSKLFWDRIRNFTKYFLKRSIIEKLKIRNFYRDQNTFPRILHLHTSVYFNLNWKLLREHSLMTSLIRVGRGVQDSPQKGTL